MTKDQARPGRQLQRRWRLLSARVRHQPDAPAEQAPLIATGSSRPRVVPLFEPAQPDPPPPRAAPTVAGPPQLVQPPRPRRRTVWAWLLAPMLTLVVGAVLGFTLGSTQARQPATVVPASSASTVSQQARPASTGIVVRHYASPACLETVKRGDRMIHMLIRNQRSEAERLLVAYTVAARQCRKDASPTP
jgi:hypothetical protein